MSTSCDQTYLLPGPVMIIKLSLDAQNLQMPCVHVKQESRRALKFGGPLRLICHVWQKSNSYGGVIISGGRGGTAMM